MASLCLPLAWHSSAPACLFFGWTWTWFLLVFVEVSSLSLMSPKWMPPLSLLCSQPSLPYYQTLFRSPIYFCSQSVIFIIIIIVKKFSSLQSLPLLESSSPPSRIRWWGWVIMTLLLLWIGNIMNIGIDFVELQHAFDKSSGSSLEALEGPLKNSTLAFSATMLSCPPPSHTSWQHSGQTASQQNTYQEF